MKALKHIAYAVFVVFLCIAPIFAFAQDEEIISRVIDFPNIEGDRGDFALTEALRSALGESHLVFSEEDMNSAATSNGAEENYWNDPRSIARLNKTIRHDAVLMVVYNSRKPLVSVTVINAFTGEAIGSFEQKMKKKGKFSKDELKSIYQKVTDIVKDINSDDYPFEIVIKINSNPSGATVSRGGIVIGTTPFEYKMTEVRGASEDWTITLDEFEPITQKVALDTTKTYDVSFIDDEAATEVQEAPKSEGKRSGSGLPIFSIAVNVSPSIFDFSISDKNKSQISHKSGIYPTMSVEILFFPCTLFSDNDYLHGLGIRLGGAYAQPLLETKFAYAKGAEIESKCSKGSDGKTYTCVTSEYKFNADIMYRLLLQKDGEEHLNHNGMALDFFAGFYMYNHIVNTNPSYNGNNFGGLRIGINYSTPIGIDQLRLAFGGSFNYNLLNEAPIRYIKLGEKRDISYGAQANVDLLYDIWKGIFIHVGYDLFFASNKYSGQGCVDSKCDKGPKDSETTIIQHEIKLGIGYMLY